MPAACDGQGLLFEFVDKDSAVIHAHTGLIKNGASVISCNGYDAPRAADVDGTKLLIVDVPR